MIDYHCEVCKVWMTLNKDDIWFCRKCGVEN